jgi:ADP-heptose:LPS heptosyltransferase
MSEKAPAPAQARPIRISARKQWLAAALGAAAGVLRVGNQIGGAKARDPARILILEPFGLGDLISFEPLVRCLRLEGRQVVLGAKPEWRALFPEGPGLTWLDLQLPWATHNEKAKYRFASYAEKPWRESLRGLRRLGKGAVGIDTRGDIRSVLMLQLAGCTRVLSLSTYLGSNVRVPARAAELVPFTSRLRRWELNLAFLEPLGLKTDLASVASPRFAHLRPAQAASSRAVGLMPVAPWRGKLWLPERWRQLTDALRGAGAAVRAFCGPGQRPLAEEQTGPGVEVIECGSVEDWARQLTSCGLIVTLDSGPMHLADALGLPVIALFGQGWLPFWAPSAEGSRVLAHQDDPDFTVCHAIDENTPLGRKYMSRIAVEEVLAAVRQVQRTLDSTQGNRAVHVTSS